MRQLEKYDDRLKMRIATHVVEEAEAILTPLGLPVNMALVLYTRTVARMGKIPEKVAATKSQVQDSGARSELQLCLPERIHQEAKAVWVSLGLTQNAAGTQFLRAVVEHRGLPFQLELEQLD